MAPSFSGDARRSYGALPAAAAHDKIAQIHRLPSGEPRFPVCPAMSIHLDVVRQFLHDRLAVDPVRVIPEATLEDLGVDSLMLLELFFEFEEKLNVSLSKDLPTPKSVGELLAVVEQLQAAPAAT